MENCRPSIQTFLFPLFTCTVKYFCVEKIVQELLQTSSSHFVHRGALRSVLGTEQRNQWVLLQYYTITTVQAISLDNDISLPVVFALLYAVFLCPCFGRNFIEIYSFFRAYVVLLQHQQPSCIKIFLRTQVNIKRCTFWDLKTEIRENWLTKSKKPLKLSAE